MATNKTPMEIIDISFGKRREEWANILPKDVDVDDFIRVARLAVERTPNLMFCSPNELMSIFSDCARDGLLPDGKQAFIDVRKTKVMRGKEETWEPRAVYIPMIEGLRRNVIGVTLNDWYGDVVREGDEYEIVKGDHPSFTHKPKGFDSDDRKIIGAYSIAKLPNGEISREFMGMDAIQKAWIAGNRNSPAYRNWPDRMAIRTVMKRHSKRLPLRANVTIALARDDDAEEGDKFAIAKPATPAKQIEHKSEVPLANGAAPHADAEGEPLSASKSAPNGSQAAEASKPAPDASREPEGNGGASHHASSAEKKPDIASPSAVTPKEAPSATIASESPDEPSKGRGRPRLTEEEKAARAAKKNPRKVDPDPAGGYGDEQVDVGLEAARMRGSDAFSSGMPRKPPREFEDIDRFDDMQAWLAGYDAERAQASSPIV